MSILSITAESGGAAVRPLGTPSDAASQATWQRVRRALAEGAGVVQIRCPNATETERETLTRSLAEGAAAQGMTVDIWPVADGLAVRRGVDERRDDRQGPTMRTGH